MQFKLLPIRPIERCRSVCADSSELRSSSHDFPLSTTQAHCDTESFSASKKNNVPATTTDGASIGFEGQLWAMADALRGSMDAAEFKHVVLVLLFLKYISDALEEQHAKLVADAASGAEG